MANSKNTIQNIPLEAPLCMNTLKTDVKQFNGYNEKNSTVFGGTLSPLYDKKTELFDKDNSYTFFNSKGVPYTLTTKIDYLQRKVIELYKGNENTSVKLPVTPTYVSKTEMLDVSSDAVAVSDLFDNNLIEVRSNGYIYKNGNSLGHLPGISGATDARIWSASSRNNDFFVGIIVHSSNGATNVAIGYFSGDALVATSDVFTTDVPTTDTPILTGPEHFCFLGKSGKYKGSVATSHVIEFDGSTNTFSSWTEDPKFFWVENFANSTDKVVLNFSTIAEPAFEVQQTVCRVTTGLNGKWQCFINAVENNVNYTSGGIGYVPTDENGFVSCPVGKSTPVNVSSINPYWQDGALISIGCGGLPIDSCLSYDRDTFNYARRLSRFGYSYKVTYKKNDGHWYCYSLLNLSEVSDGIVDYLKRLVINERYICFRLSDYVEIYDIEEDKVRPEEHLDLIISEPPHVLDATGSTETTGVVYAAGVNAGYTVNGSPFVGYLPNPFIGYNLPKGCPISFYTTRYDVDYFQPYYTTGDTAQSAKYKGKNQQYKDTLYPVDPNGNIVLPISATSEIIKGYSNNDLVKEGNTVYPLMYWNNNQKVYAYMLLSGIENISNVFSLQGQQYAVDDENIYTVSYNAGVVQNVTSVAYKKNLTFLGTLPTQAIFWSDFNKTFYAFTGDRILSKMFEASDISETYYVGQNPASLSLWVCSDSGIYVLSDKDMFRLDYNSKQVAFYSKNALIVTEGATNNEAHTISLYLNDDEQGEMIPLKLETAYYGLGSEMKAVMDCWYLRLFDEKNTKGYVKAKIHTITDVTRHTEEKTFEVNPSDYDENHIVYLRFQPKYQECVAMQLELETNLGIYQISLGVNTSDSTAQVSKFNF